MGVKGKKHRYDWNDRSKERAGRVCLLSAHSCATRGEVFHVERKSQIRPVRRRMSRPQGTSWRVRPSFCWFVRYEGEVCHVERKSAGPTTAGGTAGPRNELARTDWLVVEQGWRVESLGSR